MDGETGTAALQVGRGELEEELSVSWTGFVPRWFWC